MLRRNCPKKTSHKKINIDIFCKGTKISGKGVQKNYINFAERKNFIKNVG